MKKKYTEKQINKAKEILADSGYFGNLNFSYGDIKEKFNVMKKDSPEIYENIELTDENIYNIASDAESTIENHESIWECYWLAIESAIEDEIKGLE